VVTAGGMVGKITEIADQYITLQVASRQRPAGAGLDATALPCRLLLPRARSSRSDATQVPGADSVFAVTTRPALQLNSGRAPAGPLRGLQAAPAPGGSSAISGELCFRVRPKPGPLIPNSTECTCAPQGRVHEVDTKMNRYALWKYIVIAVACCSGRCTRCRNFFGESPRCRCRPASRPSGSMPR